ncbi:protease HtpX [Candidatus Woesearchaeota archaeon]|nr:MAG: protease HtpX [Candidatus Woesearchaeota archaeon]
MAIINQLKTTVLLGILSGILLGIGYWIGSTKGMFIGLAIAILMNFITYWYSDKIVLAMYRAREIKKKDNPNLYKIVQEVALATGIPMPRIYIIPTDQPNAFATGRNPKNAAVACTNGIINILSPIELKGVIAHELAHIKNRDILIATIAATIATVISYIAFMARFAAIFGGGDDRDGSNIISLLVLGILTPIIATIIQLAISRSREFLADETGAKTIKNPLALASALEKIHVAARRTPLRFGSPATASLFIANPFSGRSLINLFSTHPSLESRVKRLRKLAMAL